MQQPLTRINIGCGQTPTPGWLNFDNSPSIRLAKYRALAALVSRLGLLSPEQQSFVAFASRHDVKWADATRRIPVPDGSVSVLYTSHMVEHLDHTDRRNFLREAMRVLAPGGVLRIAVPDIRRLAEAYLEDGDADRFIADTLLTRQRPRTLADRVKFLVVGDRHHLWMYDGASLCRLLLEAGFRDPCVVEPGSTSIPDPGELDLFERSGSTVYVEARR